jgi:hypothetical protein
MTSHDGLRADDVTHELMDDVTPRRSRRRDALLIGLRQRLAKQIRHVLTIVDDVTPCARGLRHNL